MANSITDPRDPDYCETCGGECVTGTCRTPKGVLSQEWLDRLSDEPEIVDLPVTSHCGREIVALFAACDALTARMEGEQAHQERVIVATLEVAGIILFG